MKTKLILCLAIISLCQVTLAATNVLVNYGPLTTAINGQPTISLDTAFMYGVDSLKLRVYGEAGTNTTFDPAAPAFVAGSAWRLVNLGLAVEANDPNRFERNDAMRMTVSILDAGDADVTANYVVQLNQLVIWERKDTVGPDNVTIWAAGDQVTFVTSAANTEQTLAFGPATLSGPFGTPRGVYISAGENPARPIDCSGGSERNSTVPWEGVHREVCVRVPW